MLYIAKPVQTGLNKSKLVRFSWPIGYNVDKMMVSLTWRSAEHSDKKLFTSKRWISWISFMGSPYLFLPVLSMSFAFARRIHLFYRIKLKQLVNSAANTPNETQQFSWNSICDILDEDCIKQYVYVVYNWIILNAKTKMLYKCFLLLPRKKNVPVAHLYLSSFSSRSDDANVVLLDIRFAHMITTCHHLEKTLTFSVICFI